MKPIMKLRRILLTSLAMLIATPAAFAADRDLDGVDDREDNCRFVHNPSQIDTDSDGFGNRCDADLNDDGFVSILDFTPFINVFQRFDGDADFSGDGFVGIPDFAIFLELLGREPGPGALVSDPNPLSCNGGFCTLQVVPGVSLEAAGEDIIPLQAGFYHVWGDAQILTPDGGVFLGEADLVVDPGAGMLGTSLSPDYSIGDLAGSPNSILPARVNVETVLGAELEIEVPVYADAYYVLFSQDGILQADFDVWIGELQLGVGLDNWRLILDPVDPFIYVGRDEDVIIPTITRRGLGADVTSIGAGYGISLGGRIPFDPSVPPAIQEVLPEVQADTVFWGSLDLAPLVPILDLRLEGLILTDEDPDENGAFVFGSSEDNSRDRIRVIDVDLDPNIVLPIKFGAELDLTIAGDGEPMPVTVISSKTEMGTANESKEVWLSIDMPDLTPIDNAANGWLTMPGERAASVFYFGPEEGDNFFRGATEERIEIDSARMAAVHGVSASALAVGQTVFEINARQLEFTSESRIESFHPDVTYTSESLFRLILPTSNNAEFDLLITTTSEIGGVGLSNYGKQLTVDSFRHWGRYETPNYGYGLEGSFSSEGAWLEGVANARLPYRYAPVEQVIDIAGQIAEMEEAEAFAQADYSVNLEQLRNYQARLEQESDALEDERAGLRSAQNWLAQKRDELDAARNKNCGSCRWYDAVCLARVAACVSWKTAAVPVIEGAVAVAQGAVSIAQAGVNRLQRSYDEVAVLVSGAQRAVDLALDAREEARAALVILRAERDALPLEDGTIDAQVALRLTRDGLTGTVSGTFKGMPFGDGVVINDNSGSRACFVVPQTGEELCADL